MTQRPYLIRYSCLLRDTVIYSHSTVMATGPKDAAAQVQRTLVETFGTDLIHATVAVSKFPTTEDTPLTGRTRPATVFDPMFSEN